MQEKFTRVMGGEKIYLKDILEINCRDPAPDNGWKIYVLAVKYISDYFRNERDPIFWRYNYYETKKQRDTVFKKINNRWRNLNEI